MNPVLIPLENGTFVEFCHSLVNGFVGSAKLRGNLLRNDPVEDKDGPEWNEKTQYGFSASAKEGAMAVLQQSPRFPIGECCAEALALFWCGILALFRKLPRGDLHLEIVRRHLAINIAQCLLSGVRKGIPTT